MTAEFARKLEASSQRSRRLPHIPDTLLAEKLLLHVWADLDLFSLQSDLLNEAIDRLRAGSSRVSSHRHPPVLEPAS